MASRLAALTFAAVLAAGALTLARPYATAPREVISATPTAPAVITPTHVRLGAGESACLHGVSVAPDAELVAFTLDRPPRRDGAVAVSVTAPGYRTRAVERANRTDVRVPITPPRAATIARLCLA